MATHVVQLSLVEDKSEEEFQAFVDKFKPKKTTDDCYTPENIMAEVVAWCRDQYGIRDEQIVRPFFPGGDYENYNYPPDCVVLDNPPFSILRQIVNFYTRRNIRYFLFAPALTLFTAADCKPCYLPAGLDITYANGANVKTSFITNLDRWQLRTVPDLYERVQRVNDENVKLTKKQLPKYEYPYEVITAARAHWLSIHGQELKISFNDCRYIGAMDAQKNIGKAIFGGGFLLSERAAAERAAAERAAAERDGATCWPLSEMEQRIVRNMGKEQ